jgi:RNA polymerase sigma-70 factor (ECF subfamily)
MRGLPNRSVTDLLRRASGGNRDAFDALLPAVYHELKRLARSKLRAERPGHTLNPTALVHEAYLKLVEQDRVEWQSRSHFFAVAAQAMRRVLIDYARAKQAGRRGGGAEHVPIDIVAERVSAVPFDEQTAADLLTLDGAIEALGAFDPRAAKVVECRLFGGLEHAEIATIVGTSEATVRRSWTAGRAWLRRELGDEVAHRSQRLFSPGSSEEPRGS